MITTTSLPGATTGAAYEVTLAASGGVAPYTWSVTSGSLPGGLSLDSSTGLISGTPTASGTYGFTVAVTDSGNPARMTSSRLSITVAAPLVITTTSLPGATTGAAYEVTLAASGGVAPYTWSVTSGSLPGGLSLDSSTGLISGTPTASGTYGFTVAVTDSGNPARMTSSRLSITVTG